MLNARPPELAIDAVQGSDLSWVINVTGIDLTGAAVSSALVTVGGDTVLAVSDSLSGSGTTWSIDLAIPGSALDALDTGEDRYRWVLEVVVGGVDQDWIAGPFTIYSRGQSRSEPLSTNTTVSIEVGTASVDLGVNLTAGGGSGAAVVPMSNEPPDPPTQLWIHEDTFTLYGFDGSYYVELGGIAPAFDPTSVNLEQLNGVVTPGQGGFGYDISSATGNPAGALEALGGAPAGHKHSLNQEVIDASTLDIDASQIGKQLIIAVTADGPCQINLFNAENEPNFQPGQHLSIRVYSNSVVTLRPQEDVNLNGVAYDGLTDAFTLVQHNTLSLFRFPSSDFWASDGLTA